MNKAIVIGALGFIGFALCERLLEEEYEVIGIDYLNGKNEKIKEQKLAQIARNSDFHFINKRIENVLLHDVCEKCDIIYYSLLKNEVSEDKLGEIIIKNKKNLNTVMDYCTQTACKFVYLSSYEVFRENDFSRNEFNQKNPRNLIGKIKIEEEYEIEEYSLVHQPFSYYIVQLPTVYGPWQPDFMTFQQLINGEESPSIDSISEDVIFIKDLVESLLDIPQTIKENKTVIIGSNKRHQWEQGFNLLKNPLENVKAQDDERINNPHIYDRFIKTSILDGIQKQQKHYKHLQKLKKMGLI